MIYEGIRVRWSWSLLGTLMDWSYVWGPLTQAVL